MGIRRPRNSTFSGPLLLGGHEGSNNFYGVPYMIQTASYAPSTLLPYTDFPGLALLTQSLSASFSSTLKLNFVPTLWPLEQMQNLPKLFL